MRNSPSRFLLPLALAGVVSIPTPAATAPQSSPPSYVVESLAPGAPLDMNDAGELAGTIPFELPGRVTTTHAAVRRSGQWLDLGVLPNDTQSYAMAINNLGTAVGTSSKSGFPDPQYRAFVSRGDAIEEVTGLGYDSFANDINDAGQICGMWSPGAFGFTIPWHAVIVDGNSVTDLHDLVAAALPTPPFETRCSGINGHGDVVGEARWPTSQTVGFLYRNGTVTLLRGTDADGNGWSMLSPAAVNDSGVVAGTGLLGSPVQQRALIYNAATGSMTDLGRDLGGEALNFSFAYDINAAGHVVGEAFLPSGTRAFLYKDGAMVDLNTLIPPDSGWILHQATAINSSDEIIGYGNLGYFLLTPANHPPSVTLNGPPAVDEGAAFTLFASASDPENTPLTYEWDLDGDGTYETPGGDTIALTLDDGPASRTIGVRVTDEGGLAATASITIEVRNVPPTATLVASATTVYVNQAVTLSLTNAFDPSGRDTAAGFTYGWDCTGTGVLTDGSAATHECVYATAGTFQARGRIEDKDGGFNEYAVRVTARSPQEGIAGLIQIVEGFGLPGGIENSLVVKLRNALASLQTGDPATACAQLRAFISEVQAQAGKKLTLEQAAQAIAEAEAVRAALGCA
jgi:probable HAF family extracellular repeat protein